MQKLNEIRRQKDEEIYQLQKKDYSGKEFEIYSASHIEALKQKDLEQAHKVQEKYKAMYKRQLEQNLLDVSAKIDVEIPEQLKGNIELNEYELKYYANKYSDNYQALRMISQLAEKNSINLSIDIPNYPKQHQMYLKELDKLDSLFSGNPFNSTHIASVRKAMGL